MVSKSGDEEDKGHRNFIRWSVPLDGTIQEEPVEVLSEESTAATIRALSGLLEKTLVYIKANSYTGNGIVESCTPEGQGHRVVIQLVCNQMITIHSSNTDPGVFAVDGFLTEEEESKILEALGDGVDFHEEPEDDAAASDFSAIRSLKEALSPQANALAALTGLDSAKISIVH